MTDSLDGLKRPTRPPDPQGTFFEVEPDWREHWWGMPLFEMEDCRPWKQITVNFMAQEDFEDFKRRLEVTRLPRYDSMWFPLQVFDKPAEWTYVDEA